MIFKCPHCLYRSDKKHLYLGHIRSHTGEKPFKCRYCDYRCAQSGNRLVHERRMHEFNKPYKCKYCTYDAVQSSTLRKHIQIRHKEYCRYHCITCKDFYCQEESTLAAHLDKKHGTTRRKSIDAYMNPRYTDETNVVVKEYVQTRGRPRANKGLVSNTANQQYGTTYTEESLPSQIPLSVKHEPAGSPSYSSSSLQSPTSPTYSTHQANYKSPTQSFANTSANQPYGNSSPPPFGSGGNTPSFPSHQSHNLMSPTSGQHTTTESVENDMVDFSSLTGEYKCNQCSFQTSEEQAFMNHLVTNHSGTAVVDPNGLNSNQSTQQNVIKAPSIGQTDNPFSSGTDSQNEDACYERDLPTDKDISDLQMDVKPNYSSPLSTTISSPLHSDIASADHQHQNLTPSPQASTSRLNDSTLSPATSKDSGITPKDSVMSPGSQSTTRRSYRCRHCDIIFPDNILYAIHRGAHGFHQPFQCNLCGMDCANKYNFASHLQGCAL